jgi:hypothetical protein
MTPVSRDAVAADRQRRKPVARPPPAGSSAFAAAIPPQDFAAARFRSRKIFVTFF